MSECVASKTSSVGATEVCRHIPWTTEKIISARRSFIEQIQPLVKCKTAIVSCSLPEFIVIDGARVEFTGNGLSSQAQNAVDVIDDYIEAIGKRCFVGPLEPPR